MNILQHRFSKIMAVNGNFLGAVGCFAYGWFLWPDDPRWYGFYIIATLSFLGSLGFVIRAFGGMRALFRQDKIIAEYQSKVKPQKDAEMASDHSLKNAGMIDG